MDLERYLAVVSGRDRSLSGATLRCLLTGAEPFYGSAVGIRNSLFDRGWKRIDQVPCPVISVGNLTTGGTGKTPVVAWLVNRLRERGRRPAIVSRGYRSLDAEGNDEKRLMDQLCPEIPHRQNPRRIDSARAIVAGEEADVIVLDDGYQHRQLHRDFDLLLVDATNPWGFDRLLPRGLLREPMAGLKRASLVLITRCEHASPSRIQEIRETVRRYADVPVETSRFLTRDLVNVRGERLRAVEFAGRSVAAFCGIGNPEGFRSSLQASGLTLDAARVRALPDHFHYGPEDLRALGVWGQATGATVLVTTRKDLVKIPAAELEGIPLWALDLELEPDRRDVLMSQLDRVLAG